MIAIVSLLVVLVLSLLVVRVATVALSLTGLSSQSARFQARSAFTGSGFTTNESEKVMQHPVRRRIIMLLMLLGNAGIITAASSLILSFAGVAVSGWSAAFWWRFLMLLLGLALLWIVAHSPWVDRHLSRWIEKALRRWSDVDARDYARLLQLSGDYAVAELKVEPGDWLAERPLEELRLSAEGILVLGIHRADGTYVGAPRGPTLLLSHDNVILYGPRKGLAELDDREATNEGFGKHLAAVERQRRTMVEEAEIDQQATSRQGVEAPSEAETPAADDSVSSGEAGQVELRQINKEKHDA